MPADLTGKKRSGIAYRRDIEGLRAIAILLVLLYHARVPGFTGGFIGVDVFFVVSGYLITSLLYTEYGRKGRISLWEFYARRGRRLLPAISLVILCTAALGALVLAPVEQLNIARSAIATSVYASNIFFARNAVDYLAEAADKNPLLHTWSLGVEEQYYLLFPITLIVGLVLLGKYEKVRRLGLLSLFSFVLLISLAMSIYLTWKRQPWAFFLTPPRAWEFAIGGLGYLAPLLLFREDKANGLVTEASDLADRKGSTSISVLIGWVGLVLLILVSYLFGKHTEFPGYVALIPAAATVSILMGDEGRKWSVNRFLGFGVLQAIGKLSYSWYLWHWFLLVFADAYFETELAYGGRSLVVLVSALPALISYKLVENPIRFSRFLKPRPVVSVGLAVILTLFCAGIAYQWLRFAERSALSPEQRRYTEASDDLSEIYSQKCHVSFTAVVSKGCVFGAKNSSKRAVLYGDSHAAQWFPAIVAAAEEEGWELTVFTKSACPATEATQFQENLGRKYFECDEWRRSVQRRIKQIKPSIVFATGATHYELTDKEWSDGMEAALGNLTASSDKVVWIADTPELDFNGPYCLAREAWRKGLLPTFRKCQFDLSTALNLGVERMQRGTAERFQKAVFLDLNGKICDKSPCEIEKGGFVMYRDSHHLTSTYARSFAPDFVKLFKAASNQAMPAHGHEGIE